MFVAVPFPVMEEEEAEFYFHTYRMFSAFMLHLRNQPLWLLLPTFLGFLSLFNSSVSILKWAFITLLRPPKNLKSYGSWAVVTGSTDGIGKAFAFQLAAEGLNLILVSRNSDKLRAVSGEILAKFPCTQLRILAVDFAGDISAVGRRIEEAIEGVEVGVLINNAGMTYSPGLRYFGEVGVGEWMELVRVNVEGLNMVTKAVLPAMLKRKRGAIVNIGSGSTVVLPSQPLYAVYAATKAYVDQLSRALHVEYKHLGIDVQCQVPLFVATKMVILFAKQSMMAPLAEDYVRSAIHYIGYEARSMPYWSHCLQRSIVSFLPEALLDSFCLFFSLHFRGKPTGK
ncbi:very-long-chain 3-oxoacyl-CoA reductase 1-like [Malania oleifera]|uniref:very-long-chain 3-oxoacyl-CoA reductase 1-like n=1 Tax=Malania oleifera TaxID=397392 RepID=UPI0025AEBA7C|nr:very-long-chain 3-oxoacyl-CoA reductase 1-like [Malania oleifera]